MVLNLKRAYNLIKIEERNEWKIASRIRYIYFEYIVMPFELTDALTTF